MAADTFSAQIEDVANGASRMAAVILATDTLARVRHLETEWRRYQRRHPRPAFAPTVEQLPHYQVPGDVQLALEV